MAPELLVVAEDGIDSVLVKPLLSEPGEALCRSGPDASACRVRDRGHAYECVTPTVPTYLTYLPAYACTSTRRGNKIWVQVERPAAQLGPSFSPWEAARPPTRPGLAWRAGPQRFERKKAQAMLRSCALHAMAVSPKVY
ncbi:hypothetical protein CCMA1212_004607 [Trichoderma ghanense]|uniref:Uncharacterized protein n=1 Tax=Trichoderma ghanense TaxID=65468 RepID=A0ABY2H5C6_9HYPO